MNRGKSEAVVKLNSRGVGRERKELMVDKGGKVEFVRTDANKENLIITAACKHVGSKTATGETVMPETVARMASLSGAKKAARNRVWKNGRIVVGTKL